MRPVEWNKFNRKMRVVLSWIEELNDVIWIFHIASDFGSYFTNFVKSKNIEEAYLEFDYKYNSVII